jgi:ribosomal protein L32
MIVCPQCGPVRIAHHVDTVTGGKAHRSRVCRKCGRSLDVK